MDYKNIRSFVDKGYKFLILDINTGIILVSYSYTNLTHSSQLNVLGWFIYTFDWWAKFGFRYGLKLVWLLMYGLNLKGAWVISKLLSFLANLNCGIMALINPLWIWLYS